MLFWGGFAFLYRIMLYFTKMVQFALPVFGYQNQGPTCTMVTSCNGIIFDHTTLLSITCPTLPLNPAR